MNNEELTRTARRVVLVSGEEVEQIGKEAFAKFFEKRHFFSELGVVEPLNRAATNEEFLRYVRVNISSAHFVLKHFQWEEDGSLSAMVKNCNPIRSVSVAKRLADEEIPFLFVPRVLKKLRKGQPPKVEVITFDVRWK